MSAQKDQEVPADDTVICEICEKKVLPWEMCEDTDFCPFYDDHPE